MFCKYCGNELPENANFCPKCGKIIEDSDSVEPRDNTSLEKLAVSARAVEPDDEKDEALKREKDALGGCILKFGILSLAFGFSVWLSWLGIIFSVIARKKVKEYVSRFNETEGRATVGKSLGIAGLAVSIVLTCIMVFIIVPSYVALVSVIISSY